MRVEPGPAGVTSTWPRSLMLKKSRPHPLTLYSSRESLMVQALSSVCNLPLPLLRASARKGIVASRLSQGKRNLRARSGRGGKLGFDGGAEVLDRPHAHQPAPVDEEGRGAGDAQLPPGRPGFLDLAGVAVGGQAAPELGGPQG